MSTNDDSSNGGSDGRLRPSGGAVGGAAVGAAFAAKALIGAEHAAVPVARTLAHEIPVAGNALRGAETAGFGIAREVAPGVGTGAAHFGDDALRGVGSGAARSGEDALRGFGSGAARFGDDAVGGVGTGAARFGTGRTGEYGAGGGAFRFTRGWGPTYPNTPGRLPLERPPAFLTLRPGELLTTDTAPVMADRGIHRLAESSRVAGTVSNELHPVFASARAGRYAEAQRAWAAVAQRAEVEIALSQYRMTPEEIERWLHENPRFFGRAAAHDSVAARGLEGARYDLLPGADERLHSALSAESVSASEIGEAARRRALREATRQEVAIYIEDGALARRVDNAVLGHRHLARLTADTHVEWVRVQLDGEVYMPERLFLSDGEHFHRVAMTTARTDRWSRNPYFYVIRQVPSANANERDGEGRDPTRGGSGGLAG